MNTHLQKILDLIQQSEQLNAEVKDNLLKLAKDAAKEFDITAFKLDRTEKVKRTTAILLEETIEELEQKRKAVEAQNKELEVETALERVRTVAMAMRKPGDLLSISEILYKELLTLGFSELRNAIIQTFEEGQDYFIDYDYSDFTGGYISHIPFTGHSTIEKFIKEIRESNDAFTELIVTGKDLENWKAFRKANGEVDDTRLDDISALYYYNYSIGPGSIGISTYTSITEEKRTILKRFRNVFDFAYRRYLDVTNAEAQAKEAQIELALERVRARTMAMHQSNELAETSSILFQQIKELGFETWSCGFCIWSKNDMVELWMGAASGGLLPPMMIPYKEEATHKNIYEAFVQKQPAHHAIWQGAALEKHYAFLQTIPSVKIAIEQLEKAGLSLPAKQCYYVGFFKQGYLLLITKEPSAALEDLAKRFASVFDLTYTRFLDLQKAEAQAREAQVETALERVRSRTMAMQHSNELAEASFLLDSQVRALGIKTWGCAFNIYGDNESTEWFSSEMGAMPAYKTPRENLFLRYYEAGQTGKAIHVETFAGEDCIAHYDYLCTIPIMGDALKKVKEGGGSFPVQQTDHVVYFKYGYLLFITLDPEPEAYDIFMRFAKVFEQTYTRFLDLQKAEVQAREAQIEVAVERVRAKALAMHNSTQMLEVVNALKDEMLGLKINGVSAATIYLAEPDGDIRMWDLTSIKKAATGLQVSLDVKFNLDESDPQFYLREIWNGKEKFFIVQQDAESITRSFKWLRQYNPEEANAAEKYLEKNPIEYLFHPTVQLFNGKMSVDIMNTVPPAEIQPILLKMGAAFDLAYKRFLDLQESERRAQESQVELALERVRSRTMAMHKSDELKEVIQVLYEQLVHLEINTEHAGIVIDYKNTDDRIIWVASKHGVPSQLTIPYFDTEYYNSFNEAKNKGWDFFATNLSFEDKNSFYKELFKHIPDLPEEAKEFYFGCPGLAISTVLLDNVGLYIENFEGVPYSDEDNAILMRFGKVFQQTYTRFLDLQKAEAQAREAQVEAALERVRSRTLAMQKSDELAATAAVLFQQLIALGIEPNRLYISIVKNEDGDTEFWITDEDGTKVSTAFAANMHDNTIFRKMFEGWQQQQKSLVINMEGEELQEYFRYLTSLGVPFKDGLDQKRRVQDIAYFSKGFIGMASPDEQPAETLVLLERFAAVFNLTFTRFSDLKIAEAHAIQAEEDLIKLQTEKKRAEDALGELRATQTQLIQSEKMASLGELTAGIAHEIQNPLNFVNNFSEVSNELIDELLEERDKPQATRDISLENDILNDIKKNLEKINHHGKRADGIVKGMLQHSRTTSATKELTDINKLADEYLRLAYHGLRAKDKSFNATLETSYDEAAGSINIIPQDIGRVVLNLITNAFYAVSEKKRQATDNRPPQAGDSNASVVRGPSSFDRFEPTVSISTKKEGNKILISVKDNGNGIPKHIIDKIFQPFFTTKPTGQGTGLGLSLAYDIVKAHAGELKVETKENKWSVFIISLPV